jgi:radical SAM superfamily enzyme YgiQ (UPF0313 family)
MTSRWESATLRFALCYPDAYEVAMSNLALPILYQALNSTPGVLAERVFAPWADMEKALRASNLHLFSLESRHSLSEFDVVAFSLGYELTYTNVLTVLDLGGIPLLRRERTQSHPLVIAGGSCTVNPEPMADFIDLFFIGEAEEGLSDLVQDCVTSAPSPNPSFRALPGVRPRLRQHRDPAGMHARLPFLPGGDDLSTRSYAVPTGGGGLLRTTCPQLWP